MNLPGEQPQSAIWSRWRERRATRTRETAPPSSLEDQSRSGPEPADEPLEPPGAGSPGQAGAEAARPPPQPPPGASRDPGFGEGAGFERGTRFESAPPPFAAHHGADGRECLEWCPICRTADVVRASVPPEIREQWQDVQREALVTVRALIDHYIDRLERQPGGGSSRVEDIPIQ